MKNNHGKRRDKIAVLIALVLVLSLLPLTSLAATAQTVWQLPSKSVRLLCIGDATSNGAFLSADSETAKAGCYPARIESSLKELYGEENVSTDQYCYTTMRWTDLRIILEKGLGKTNGIWATNDDDNNNLALFAGETGTEAFCTDFGEGVKNADLIIIDLGMNDFAESLQVLMADFDNYGEAKSAALKNRNIDNIKTELDDLLGAGTAEKVRTLIQTKFSAVCEDAGATAVNGLVYAYGAVLLNYAKSLSYIYEVNPDVNITIVGLYNGIGSLKIGTVDAGQLWGEVVSSINGFLAGTDTTIAANPYGDKIYYCAPGSVSTLITEIQNDETLFGGDPAVDYGKGKEGVNDHIIDNFIEAFYRLNGEDITADFNETLNSQQVVDKIVAVIKEKVKGNLGSESLEETIIEKIDDAGPTLINLLLEGIKQNCCSDPDAGLTAEDIKQAYQDNETEKLDINELLEELGGGSKVLGITRALSILNGDYAKPKSTAMKKLTSMLQSKEYDVFAVVMIFEMFRENMKEAITYTDISVTDTSAVLTSDDNYISSVLSALLDFDGDSTTAGQKGVLALSVRGVMQHSFATLPDTAGANAKCANMSGFLPVFPTTITLDKSEIKMNTGAQITLLATVLPAEASYQSVNWISSDVSVATVENGVVKAVGSGTAVITAQSAFNENIAASCPVTVSRKQGDLNGDNEVTLEDAELAKNIAMKATTAVDEAQKTAGDIDGNGVITINEARKIKRWALE